MASFTAGTTFSDGVANDVTAAKLGTLVTNATPTPGFIQDRTVESIIATNDTLLIGDASDSNNLKQMTVANLLKAPLVSTSGTVDNLTTGTTTSTAQIVTSGTFLGTITGSTNVVNIGSGQIYKDASGNVGIGTTSPSGKLHVNGQTYIQGTVSGGLANSTLIANSSGQAQFWGLGPDVSTTGSMAFVVSRSNLTSSLQALTIDSSGNVGIGTTSPDAKLAIDAPGGSTPTAPISCNATSGAGDRYAALFRYSGTLSGSVTVNGAAAAYNTSSDYRLKTNLEPISNGIERIKQLPVYRFNWKTNENGNKVDGFVAHEVTPIVREAIHGEKDAVDSDGNPIYQGIDQSKIVPLLTAALKEAIAKIETLEAKVAALEAA